METQKHFALAGNPNSGKTTLFNSLTGSTAHVGNWPGVTVDKREGTYKKLGKPIHIVDLPGIYSLSPYTAEEIISRNYILEEKPDCVINIIDATNLERNLYLTTQLLEIDVPIVIGLNMSDVVRKNGDKIDAEELSKKIGVPVVEISALRNENLDELISAAYNASLTPREGTSIISNKELGHLINDVKIAFKGKGVNNPLFHAVKLVELDELETKDHPDLLPMVEDFKHTFNDEIFGDDFEALIADARYKCISKNYATLVMKNPKNDEKNETITQSDKIDKVLTHRIWGLPIFVLIMFFIFHFTFSEDLFFLNRLFGVEITNQGWINFFTGMGYDGEALGGVPSIGVFLQSWMGWITGSIIDWFSSWMPEGTWYTSLICDGVLNGLDAVLSFIPQIMILFLFIAILEDSGYMARVAFILDRAFRKFGLSGKAFIPMLTGFGCSVPAIMATRTLEDEREKKRTIRLMTCFSCGAKAPIWTMLAAVGVLAGFDGGLFLFVIYMGGIASAIIFAIFMKLLSKDQYVSPFIMELPAYHLPQFRNVMAHLWEKLKHYVVKASTIIAASLVLIWFLSSFNFTQGFLMIKEEIVDEITGLGTGEYEYVLHIENSILAYIGKGFGYVFYPLGFSWGENGWIYSVASITGLVAKEDVVGTLGTLFGLADASENEVGALLTFTAGAPAVWSYAVFNLFTIPCFAAISAAHGELRGKEFWFTILWWFAMSYVASFIVFWIGMLFAHVLWLGIITTILLIAIIVIAGIVVARRNKMVQMRN